MKTLTMLLLLAVPASAIAAQPAAAPPADEAKSKKKERKICKGETRSSSRISTVRICRTATEWNEPNDQGIANVPMDHSYKAQLGNGQGLAGPN